MSWSIALFPGQLIVLLLGWVLWVCVVILTLAFLLMVIEQTKNVFKGTNNETLSSKKSNPTPTHAKNPNTLN